MALDTIENTTEHVNVSVYHDDSVDISQVLVVPKSAIVKPVMFSIIRMKDSVVEGKLKPVTPGPSSEKAGVFKENAVPSSSTLPKLIGRHSRKSLVELMGWDNPDDLMYFGPNQVSAHTALTSSGPPSFKAEKDKTEEDIEPVLKHARED